MVVAERVFDALKYRPHEGQRRVHRAMGRARHRVNAAGRRTGKSTGGGHELTLAAMASATQRKRLEDLGIRREYWIVGPTYVDAEKEFRVFSNDLKNLQMPLDKPGSYYDARSGNMQVSLWGGLFLVQAKSAMKPETLVGEGLHGVVMAEAAKMKASTWSKYVRPTLADFSGWSLWNSTPEGRNHFYEMWENGQNPAMPEWASFRTPSWMNQYVFKNGMTEDQLETLKSHEPGRGPQAALAMGADPEIVGMYQELGEVMFGQEVECAFSEFAGLVYPDFDEETHVGTFEYNPRWPVYVATDYGYTNPNVALFLQVDPFDNIYILGEYYERMRNDTEFAADVLARPRLRRLAEAARELFPDPEDPGATRVLADAWKVSPRTGTGGLLKNRIQLARQWMKIQNPHLPFGHTDRQPKFFVDRSCVNMIDEFSKYRYPDLDVQRDKDAPENPLKKDDHAMEAMSRFFAGKYGQAITGKTRVRKATVRR